ncbi:FAD linked oxidase domain protein [Sterolibacterium denitrificans]|uniref:FAD linked oxidase domain protein n=2 Tax=Sterolibacterium denitrificans TaxID=157592 RepID=A0A7Z7HS94_9PROT|nr:FAD-binding oxidoreductase [Sterolibacterium denitrificans]KYC29125.1 2-hydroxyacid dehydrogenase [Sterolibacterium denitrificans]SMB29103.1 FAD linked oxidase domain protein [Sterolibacterium denitrificans]
MSNEAARQAADALKLRLSEIVGSRQVLTEAADTQPYLHDWRGRYHGQALCVVRPGTTAEVAAVVAACAQAGAGGIAMVPQGGNTGLVGGGVPCNAEADSADLADPLASAGRPQVVISLQRLQRIRAIDTANHTLTAEAGCTLQQVQEAAAEAGLLFPLAIASQGTATIGGNLSTNAGGVQVLRYGNMRELTLGLEVVLADGRIWDGLRGLRKDNTGYDLKQLFIGAEGTLGLITAAVLKLHPRPRAQLTAWLALPDPQVAVELLGRLRQHFGERVSAFEIINRAALELVFKHVPDTHSPLSRIHDWQLLLQLDASSAAEGATLADDLSELLVAEQAAGRLLDAVLAQSETQAAALWKLRESISEAQKKEGFSIKHDVSLPISRLHEFIEQTDARLTSRYPGVRIVCFGHLGDGNLHYNPSQPLAEDNRAFIAATAEVNRLVHDLVHALGGSISAEHGLGQLKREEILRYKSPLEIELMRNIKTALDPRGLMNPGKLLSNSDVAR